jgi:hypothetical protein
MRIIFLDIDGVLNDHVRWENTSCKIRYENVAVLNRILAEVPDAKVVISSSWRYMIDPAAMTLKGFEYLLMVAGLNIQNRLFGYTCRDEELPTRGKQIRAYLEKYQITKFVILDDIAFDFKERGLISNFVQTDAAFGLMESQIPAIIQKFR